jgi:hypothetical protein
LAKKSFNNKQKYKLEISDAIVIFTLLSIICMIALRHYDGTLLSLNYATVDPSVHIKNAEDFVTNHNLEGMYYSKLINGIFFDVLIPFFGKFSVIRLFVFSELFNLFLSGMIFFAITENMVSNKKEKTFQIIFSAVYMLGFPLNNMIYGFTYLGMGVSIVLVITYIFNNLVNKEQLEMTFFLMLANYAIFECYVLFVPVIYLAEFVVIVAEKRKEKEILKLKTFVKLAIVFLVPILMGFWYTYRGIFKGGVTVGSAITNEGTIYRDFFSNFIVLSVLTIGYVITKIKKRKASYDFLSMCGIFMVIFLVGFFYIGVKGKASSYYYYKNYYLCWAIMFVMSFWYLLKLFKYNSELVAALIIVILLIVVLGMGNVERRVNKKNPLFVPEIKAEGLTDIFRFNFEKIKERPSANRFNKIIAYVNSDLKNENVAPATFFEDTYWFEASTWKRIDIKDRVKIFLYGNISSFKKYLICSNTKYVVVYYEPGNALYYNNRDFFDNLQKVYEDENGFIGKVKSK